MTARRRLMRASVLAVVVVLGFGLWNALLAMPAPAATPFAAGVDGTGDDARVQLSADRETWAENLDVSLLDPDMLWVPGDSETASLWIRNASTDDADGYAEVTFGSASMALSNDLAVRTRYDDGPWSAGTTSTSVQVTAGQDVRLDVEVSYVPTARNDSMAQTVPMSIRVVLAAADGTVEPPPGEPGEPGGPGQTEPPEMPGDGSDSLPVTGAEVAQAVVAAGLLVVAGAWLVVAARRRGMSDG